MHIGWDRHLRFLGGTVAALALAAGCAAVAAQEATELEMLTVTGQAGAAGEDALTRTADSEELARKMVDDLSDLGRLDAAASFSRSSKSIQLRGLDQNRVLTTIDGIRVPWLTDARDSVKGGLDAFDFDTISAVDITRGANSVRHGSGALGGVVGFRTLDPEELVEEGRHWGAILKGGYDSADASWRTHGAIAARFDETWLLVQGGFLSGHEMDNKGTVGGYGESRTLPDPADTKRTNLLVKLHQHVEGGHRLRFTGEMFDRDEKFDNMTGTTSSYEEGSLRGTETVKRDRLSLSYDFVSPDGEDIVDEADITAYWLRQRLKSIADGIRIGSPYAPDYYGYPFGPYFRDNEMRQTSYGLTGDAMKTLELGGRSQTLRFGTELYRQDTHQYVTGIDNCPDLDWSGMGPGFQPCRFLHANASDMPDVASIAFGAYVENEIQLGGGFTLTPGLRFDAYEHKPVATAAFEHSPNFDGLPAASRGSNLSAKVHGAWQAGDHLELYAQWAQAFRAPTALELYQNFGAPGSYVRIGNPDLVPETGNGFEIGAQYDDGTVALAASLFSNSYRNFIDMVQIEPPGGEYPVNGVVGYVNRARVHMHGAELRGEWKFATDWRLSSSVAWTVGRDTDLDEHLNSIPPLRAILGLGYATEEWGADLSVAMAAARDRVGPGGFRAPAHAVVDVTGWWEPEQFQGLRLQAGVFNLFDTKYWNAVDVPDDIDAAVRDRYSEPGRTFRLSIAKRF